ncbi:MAG: hypothetical protein FJY95_17735 [Candidatus Handelsmanbacteria bacterium]|nr:hypothetical protein [Candidatus Handelsmanbacteria bacterium]
MIRKKLCGMGVLLLTLLPAAVFADGGKYQPKNMGGQGLGVYTAVDDTALVDGKLRTTGSQELNGTWTPNKTTILPAWAGGTSANGSSAWTTGQYLKWDGSQKKVISAEVELTTKQNADADLDSASITHYRASLFDLPDSSASTPCGATQAGQLMYSVASGKLNICNGTSWGPITYDRDGDGLSSALDDNDASAFTAPTAAAADVISSKTFRTGASLTPTTGTISSSSAGNLATVDADLAAPNIRNGVTLFGVAGTFTQTGAWSRQVFTGNGTWTRPSGVDTVYVTMVGGGGAGSVRYDNWMLGGNGGGGGGFCHRVKVAVTGNVTVTIGSAGSVPGGSGGATSFAATATISVGGGGGGGTPGEYYSYGGGGGSASSAATGAGGRGGNNPFSPENDRPAKPAIQGGHYLIQTGNGSGLYVGGSGGGGGMKSDNPAPEDNCTAGAAWGSTSGGPCGTEYAGAAAGGGGAASPYGSGGTGASYNSAGSAGQGYGAGGGGSAGSTGSQGPYAGSAGYCLVEWMAVQ